MRHPCEYGEPVTASVGEATPFDVRIELPWPVDVAQTLRPLQHGSYRIEQNGPASARCRAWGPGAEELVAGLPALLGADDDASGFAPEHPLLADAHRRLPGLRIPRTGRVFEALVPAVLEQRVHGIAAFASWRRLVTRFAAAPSCVVPSSATASNVWPPNRPNGRSTLCERCPESASGLPRRSRSARSVMPMRSRSATSICRRLSGGRCWVVHSTTRAWSRFWNRYGHIAIGWSG